MRPATTECITRDAVREASARLWRPVLAHACGVYGGFMLQVALWHPHSVGCVPGYVAYHAVCCDGRAFGASASGEIVPSLWPRYKVAFPLSAIGFYCCLLSDKRRWPINACAQLGYAMAVLFQKVRWPTMLELRLPSALLFFARIRLHRDCAMVVQRGFVGRKDACSGRCDGNCCGTSVHLRGGHGVDVFCSKIEASKEQVS